MREFSRPCESLFVGHLLEIAPLPQRLHLPLLTDQVAFRKASQLEHTFLGHQVVAGILQIDFELGADRHLLLLGLKIAFRLLNLQLEFARIDLDEKIALFHMLVPDRVRCERCVPRIRP